MTSTQRLASRFLRIVSRHWSPPPICASHQTESPSASSARTSGSTRRRSSALYETNTSDISGAPAASLLPNGDKENRSITLRRSTAVDQPCGEGEHDSDPEADQRALQRVTDRQPVEEPEQQEDREETAAGERLSV